MTKKDVDMYAFDDAYTKNLPLPRKFYAQDTVDVAKSLLGAVLVHKGRRLVSGIISETEAYRQSDDPASHAYRRMTPRNRIMFGPVGMAYVYFTYGMHFCFNVTARDPKIAAGAVLVRGLLPKSGVKTMMQNRGTTDSRILTNGPAKLTQAMSITKKQYGEDLTVATGLFVTGDSNYVKTRYKITAAPRVGIKEATDRLWNFKLGV